MGAFQQPYKSMTVIPGVDLQAHRHKFVHLNANGKGILAAAGGATVGILQEPNDVDQPANVMIDGISFVYFDGAVAPGDEVEVGLEGRAKKLSTGKKAGICIVGGADGEVGSVLIK